MRQHQASFSRYWNAVKRWLPVQKTTSGGPALHCAISSGYNTLAQILLEYKADVNCTDHDQENALHIATRHGFVESMEFLLQNGISIDAANYGGETALHLSAGLGIKSALQYLLNKSADMEIQNKIGQTALQLAMLNDHPECARCLIAAGANVDTREILGKLKYSEPSIRTVRTPEGI